MSDESKGSPRAIAFQDDVVSFKSCVFVSPSLTENVTALLRIRSRNSGSNASSAGSI